MSLLLGVMGDPIAHSRSPEMHRAALRVLGLEGDYVKLHVRSESFSRAVTGLPALGFRGANVTLPHKRTAFEHCERYGSIDKTAALTGAVNTLSFSNGHVAGSNTDVFGVLNALPSEWMHGGEVVILGAGGAARAAVVAAALGGARRIFIATRDDKGAKLAKAMGTTLRAESISPEVLGGSFLHARESFARAETLIQATSAPMSEESIATAFVRSLPTDALRDDAIVFEMVYKPARTALLRTLPRNRHVLGVEMLLHQGAKALSQWIDRPLPEAAINAMRETLR